MSKMLNTDDIEFSSWRYATFEMEVCLKKIIETKFIEKGNIPEGIYKDLLHFFDLTLGAIHKSKEDNRLAQIENYRIAANAIRKCIPTTKNRIELNKNLVEYAELFKSLTQERKLEGKEIEKIKELQLFFNKIFMISDSRVYESVVASQLEI